MTRYAVISADGHAGPPAEVYREYLDPGFRDRFDEHQRAMEELRAAMGRTTPSEFQQEWEEETGGDGGLTAAYDSAARNAVLDEEGVVGGGAVPGRRRARHRPHRVVAVRDRARRRVRQRRGGGRREPRAQPLARRLRARGTASPHRHRGDPGDHPRHGHGARVGARSEGARAHAASSSRPAGSTVPRTTTRGTSRCGRSPRSSASCCTRTRARARATSASGPGMLPIYASEAGWWAAPSARGADLGRHLRASPEPEVLDGRERGVVGAGPDPQDGREVDRRPQHPQVRRRVPRGAVDEAERLPEPQLLLRRVDARRGRHRSPLPHRHRQHHVGQRPPASRGHVPVHALLDPQAVQGRPRGRDATHARPHRGRGLRRRPRRAAAARRRRSARPSTKSTATRRCRASPPASELEPRRGAAMSITGSELRDLQRVPDAARPAGVGGSRAATDRAERDRRTALPVPGPERLVHRRRGARPHARRDEGVQRVRHATSCCSAATTARRTWSTRTARTSARTSASAAASKATASAARSTAGATTATPASATRSRTATWTASRPRRASARIRASNATR